jgi:protein TonB
LFSVTAHIVGACAVLLASILVPGVLPRPHAASLEWDPTARMVRLDDIPLPPPKKLSTPTLPTTSDSVAPTEAPNGITPEEPTLAAPPEPKPGFIDGGDVGGRLAPPPPPPVEKADSEQRRGPVRVSGGVLAPRKILDVAPVYPSIARAAGAQGLVIIEATIDTAGNVVAARVLRQAPPLLETAALDAVRQWKYEPARLNGEPVDVLITVTVNFVLGR